MVISISLLSILFVTVTLSQPEISKRYQPSLHYQAINSFYKEYQPRVEPITSFNHPLPYLLKRINEMRINKRYQPILRAQFYDLKNNPNKFLREETFNSMEATMPKYSRSFLVKRLRDISNKLRFDKNKQFLIIKFLLKNINFFRRALTNEEEME